MKKYCVFLVWFTMLISVAAIVQGEPADSGDEAAMRAAIE
jgi:hypothetical protein